MESEGQEVLQWMFDEGHFDGLRKKEKMKQALAELLEKSETCKNLQYKELTPLEKKRAFDDLRKEQEKELVELVAATAVELLNDPQGSMYTAIDKKVHEALCAVYAAKYQALAEGGFIQEGSVTPHTSVSPLPASVIKPPLSAPSSATKHGQQYASQQNPFTSPVGLLPPSTTAGNGNSIVPPPRPPSAPYPSSVVGNNQPPQQPPVPWQGNVQPPLPQAPYPQDPSMVGYNDNQGMGHHPITFPVQPPGFAYGAQPNMPPGQTQPAQIPGAGYQQGAPAGAYGSTANAWGAYGAYGSQTAPPLPPNQQPPPPLPTAAYPPTAPWPNITR